MLQGHWKDPSMTAKALRDKHQITTGTVSSISSSSYGKSGTTRMRTPLQPSRLTVKMTASFVSDDGTRTRVSPGWYNLKIIQLRTRRQTLEVQKARSRSSLKKFKRMCQDAIGPPPTPCRNVVQGLSSCTSSQWTLSPCVARLLP